MIHYSTIKKQKKRLRTIDRRKRELRIKNSNKVSFLPPLCCLCIISKKKAGLSLKRRYCGKNIGDLIVLESQMLQQSNKGAWLSYLLLLSFHVIMNRTKRFFRNGKKQQQQKTAHWRMKKKLSRLFLWWIFYNQSVRKKRVFPVKKFNFNFLNNQLCSLLG